MANNVGTSNEEFLPPYLPPRRPKSLPNLTRSNRSSWHLAGSGAAGVQQPTPAAQRSASRARRKLTKRRQQAAIESAPLSAASTVKETASRPTSYQSFSSGETAAVAETGLGRHSSNGSDTASSKDVKRDSSDLPSRTSSKLASIPDGRPLKTQFAAPTAVRVGPRPAVLRKSSLRVETRLSDEDLTAPPAFTSTGLGLGTSHSDPQLRRGAVRPYSYPASKSKERVGHEASLPPFSPGEEDPWRLPSLPPSRLSTPTSPPMKPRASFKRLSSLDNLLNFREERASWKRASSLLQQPSSEPSINDQKPAPYNTPDESARPSGEVPAETESSPENEKPQHNQQPQEPPSTAASEHGDDNIGRKTFRHPSAEYGFIFTVAVMQLLAEYLITGFALELPALLGGRHSGDSGADMGLFWPATLLTLILSATLLIFARLSDMYGGYHCFMFGVLWLALWTLIPGFESPFMMLNISRAMQGLAIAAYMPSTFALIGTFYPEGPRRNIVLGFYSGCAPVGFFAGFLVAGALPDEKTNWYFWTASIISFAMAAVAYVSVPTERMDRTKLQLSMDWIGAFLITAGLILLAYSLSVEPYVNQTGSERSGFAFPECYGPLAAGVVCLAVAFWYEGWQATCPILPFDFFTPKSVKALSLASLCFYASYGVWLYNSAEFFQSPSGISRPEETGLAITGIELALWYAPTAIGGILLCVFSGALLHLIPIMILLLLSAVAWLAAPLLLALAPLPLNYWSYVLPSMLCATIGLDLTYTVCIIFLSSVQPLKYQGLSGAVASSLINLGMSFALPISEIAMKKAQDTVDTSSGDLSAENKSLRMGFRAAFFYATASAGLGLIICVLFVRISRGVVSKRPADEEQPRAAMSEATLVGENGDRTPAIGSEQSSQHRRESV